jgi:sulfite exporter TauE/SafE
VLPAAARDWRIATRAAGPRGSHAAGSTAFARVLPRVQPLVRGDTGGSRLALGVLWGFVPCTLVYSVLPLALFAGGAWQGALVMLVFGAGTLPHLRGRRLRAVAHRPARAAGAPRAPPS